MVLRAYNAVLKVVIPTAATAAALLAGCGHGFPATIPLTTSTSTPTPNPTPNPSMPAAPTVNAAVTAKNIYSVNLGNQSLDVYTASLNGTAFPSSSYPGGALSVTGDLSGNLYAAAYSQTQAEVRVYPAGSLTQSRSITVATATANAPQITTMAVDSGGYLYVAISSSILVYDPTASGAAAPVRAISGAQSMLSATVTQMAFDSGGNLYVATGAGYKGSQVVRFAAGASGNVAPILITSPDYFPSGVTLDAADNLYIVQGSAPSPYNGSYTPAINVFPKGAVAGASPSRTISGGNIGIAIYTGQIFVDSGGNIFISAVLNGQTDFLVYSATSTGNSSPSSKLVRSQGSTTDSQFYLR